MHTNLQNPPAGEDSRRAAFWACMAAWAVSFLLPAVRTNSLFLQDSEFGFQAFLSSMMAFFVPIYGWVWPVNIFMALAPIFARRMNRGKNVHGYILLLCAWTTLSLGVPIYQCLDYAHHIVQLQIGFYLWQFSLLGTATWFLWMLYRRPILLAVMSLVSISFLFGSAVVTPQYVARRDLRKAVRDAEARVAAFERTGQPEAVSVSGWELMKFVDAGQPGMQEFQIANGYMQDIYKWRQRERIADSTMIDRYPEVPVHFSLIAQTHPSLKNVNDSALDAGNDGQPWIEYRDLQAAALKRAKLYLRNAEIDLGMVRGQRQLPELLGSADVTSAAPLAKRDLPAHFSSIHNLVQVQRSGRQAAIPVDNQTSLSQHDTVATGVKSAATIVFADKTVCTMQADSQLAIDENAVNASGKTFVKMELVNGRITLDSLARVYGSSLQVALVMLSGTIDLGPESSMEMETDYKTSQTQVLLKKGSAQVRLSGEAPIPLLEHEKLILANNGLRSKTMNVAGSLASAGPGKFRP